MASITLKNGDCLTELDTLPDKTVQLICIDPPYNIGKDTWDSISNYQEFMLTAIKKLEMKLRDNGSFFMFHNDMETISELMMNIKQHTRFKFNQMIVWNKRFEGSPRKGFMDGFVVKNEMHTFNKMAEYILFYTFDNSYKLKDLILGIPQMTAIVEPSPMIKEQLRNTYMSLKSLDIETILYKMCYQMMYKKILETQQNNVEKRLF